MAVGELAAMWRVRPQPARAADLTLTSLDGFIGDGDYSWSAPDEEVMAALNAEFAEVGTYLSNVGAGAHAAHPFGPPMLT